MRLTIAELAFHYGGRGIDARRLFAGCVGNDSVALLKSAAPDERLRRWLGNGAAVRQLQLINK
jgi:hypothetical protein